eukprot:COSAG02_NODE_2113_length_9800_cov_53.566643_3_plen_51_part_00
MSWKTSPASRKCTVSLGVYTGRLCCGAAVLSRVVLEFRLKLHEMNRVAEF